MRHAFAVFSVVFLLLSTPQTAQAAGCLQPVGDVDGSGFVNVVDVQCAILVSPVLWQEPR